MPYEYATAADEEEQAYDRLKQLARTATIEQFAMQAPMIVSEEVADQEGGYNSGDSGGEQAATAPRDGQAGYFANEGAPQPFTANPGRAMEALSQVPLAPVIVPTRPRSNGMSIDVATQRSSLQTIYVAERQDGNHHMATILQDVAGFLKIPFMVDRVNNQRLFSYLNTLTYFEMAELLKKTGGSLTDRRQDLDTRRKKGREYSRQHLIHFMKGVAYLDEAARKSYKVKVDKGLLMFRGKPLDTAEMQTVFSGMNFAIWVMSPPIGKKSVNKVYTNSHTLGSFHHSSFLSGDDVVAAGEWQVTNGVLKVISSKTGHYKCSLEQLKEAMRVMQGWGVDISNAMVRYFEASIPKEMVASQFMVEETQYLAASAGGANLKGNFPVKPGYRFDGKTGIGGHRNK